jgi:hypothetical protein
LQRRRTGRPPAAPEPAAGEGDKRIVVIDGEVEGAIHRMPSVSAFGRMSSSLSALGRAM